MKRFIDPGLDLLPSKMDTLSARAMMYAIAFHESGFQRRKQMNKGPGRSFWQFEKTGINCLFKHEATEYQANLVLARLYINKEDVYEAITYSDALASAFARLNLWWLPRPLPKQNEVEEAWGQYKEAWRPGKPRKEKWEGNFTRGWELALALNKED